MGLWEMERQGVFTSFKPPTILTPKRSDVYFILTSWVLAYPNLTQIERVFSIHGSQNINTDTSLLTHSLQSNKIGVS